jgi:hypothetical protein
VKAIVLKTPFEEQKTTLTVSMGHLHNRPQGVQTCTSLQESGTVLLASAKTSLYLLDSLIAEVYCKNKLLLV